MQECNYCSLLLHIPSYVLKSHGLSSGMAAMQKNNNKIAQDVSELLRRHSLQKLALGCAGVSNNAHVDVSSQGRAFHGGLGDPTKEHEQDATLHLIITWGEGNTTYTNHQ